MASLSDVYENALARYEELHRQGKLKSEQLAMIKGKSSIGDILKNVDQAKAKNESERKAGMRFVHKITPGLISRLERVSQVVEVAVAAKPEIAALVWSGIKFIVLISRDILDVYGKACDIVEKISLCLERFDVYYEVVGVTTLLKSRFVTFYIDILNFCLKGIGFYTRGKLKTLGASIWGSLSKPFDDILLKIVSHADEIDKAANAEHMRMTKSGFRRQAQTNNTPLSPQYKIFKVPDLVHRHFTGRVEQLQQINQMLADSPQGSKRISIFGMPGVGKTQVALKHVQENKDHYSNVFYIQATDREQLYRGYETIYGLLQLPEFSSASQELKIEGVKRWLINNLNWLIVFDNVVHADTVREFLPVGSAGTIIFTMRDDTAAKELGLAGKLEILPMDKADGIELILNISEISASSADPESRRLAADLNNELGGLPLALEQSVVYLNNRQWPLEKYLDLLRAQKIETLKLGSGDESTSYSKFYSSFSLAIQGITPAAVTVLKIISHLGHQELPQKLFDDGASGLVDFLNKLEQIRSTPPVEVTREGKKPTFRSMIGTRTSRFQSVGCTPQQTSHDTHLYSLAENSAVIRSLRQLFSDTNELEKAILCLQTSALIQRKARTIWMHDLVRDLSENLIIASEKKIFAAAAIVMTNSAIPANSRGYEILHILKPFALHIASSFRHTQFHQLQLLDGYNAASTLGEYYHRAACYNEALDIFRPVLAGRETILGRDHLETLSTVRAMALVFESQGKYGKAQEWYERVLAGRGETLGKDHPDTLCISQGMASVFESQGEYDKALEWFERTLVGREKILEDNHAAILTTIHSIAWVFCKKGEYIKALEWSRRALAGREKTLGEGHPDTLATVHNMGTIFENQGEYSKALEWYERALAGREEALGKDHPVTLSTVHTMAWVYQNQWEYAKSQKWHERALAGREKVLGKDHPDTLATIHAMAWVFFRLGKYRESLEWHERALAGREKALGKDHPHTLSTVQNLAVVFGSQWRNNEALEMHNRVLAKREETLGQDHPHTLSTVENIALVFENQGEYTKALEWYGRTLAGREKILGKDHPSTLASAYQIALVFGNQGNYNEALEWLDRVLAGREKVLGKDHPNTLATIHSIAVALGSQGRYSEALERYGQALSRQAKILGEDHPCTLLTIYNMALAFDRQGDYSKALEYHTRALDGREKFFGKDHPNTIAVAHSTALVFENQKEYCKAIQWYIRALAGKEKTLGKDHPDTLAIVHSIAVAFNNQGNYSKALEWYERALAGREKVLGRDHIDTLTTVHNMATVFSHQGEHSMASELYERALVGRGIILGKDHPNTLPTARNLASASEELRKAHPIFSYRYLDVFSSEISLGGTHLFIYFSLFIFSLICGIYTNYWY